MKKFLVGALLAIFVFGLSGCLSLSFGTKTVYVCHPEPAPTTCIVEMKIPIEPKPQSQ